MVSQALVSGTLTSTKGTFVSDFQKRFARLLGAAHGYACASGTAAVHTAIAALDPEPGDEIVTSPITDMGALAPILYQGGGPRRSRMSMPTRYNITAARHRARAQPGKTKAILVTHLFGNPCEMASDHGAGALTRHPGDRGLRASIPGATCGGAFVGTLGAIGCFSLQQGKHITTGEGGIVVTDDPALARRMYLFINKAWGYGDPKPDHYFLALNYRMSELQGAVALAQLESSRPWSQRRDAILRISSTACCQMCQALKRRWSPTTPCTRIGNTALRVDPSDQFATVRSPCAKAARSSGIFTVPRYIQKPAFACEVFSKQRTFGNSRWPFTLARPEAVDYSAATVSRHVYDALEHDSGAALERPVHR